ncbi:MAG: hypothetical protein AAFX93_18405 [Verrucomicrobiota bacterium]
MFLALVGCREAPTVEEPRVLAVEIARIEPQSQITRQVNYFGLIEPRQISELGFELD